MVDVLRSLAETLFPSTDVLGDGEADGHYDPDRAEFLKLKGSDLHQLPDMVRSVGPIVENNPNPRESVTISGRHTMLI